MKYLVAISVALMLGFGIANQLFHLVDFTSKDENREFAKMPDFDVNHLDGYGTEMDEYINDNFSFREPLLDIYHFVKVKVFNVSPKPDVVIKGLDGWLFSSEDKYMDTYLARKDTSDLFFKPIVINWKARKKYFDQNSISVYYGIIPSKLTAYSDKMPLYFHRTKTRNQTDVFIDKLTEILGDNVIDFRLTIDSLRKESPEEHYYRKLDNHWNMKGAFYANQALVNTILKTHNCNVLNQSDFDWEEYEVDNGIHAKRMGYPNSKELNWKPKFKLHLVDGVKKYGFDPPKGFPYPFAYENCFRLKDSTNSLKALIIHDSFTERMRPFLKHSFGESVFIFDSWQYGFNKQIIEKVNPDIVIYLSVEYLINNNKETAVKENAQYNFK